MTAHKKRHGKQDRKTASKWAATTALAPALLLPATLLCASSSFPAAPHAGDGRLPREVGVNGNLPQEPMLSPDVLERAADPRQLAAGVDPHADLPTGVLGIPEPLLAAYQRAAGQVDRACGLHWSVLASIGRIESGHARSGGVDRLGTTVRAILGPRLSGGVDIAAIADTDAGRYDGDPVWDRAMGPMQFIPSTWLRFGVDGNEDGIANPHNIHDSTLAAAQYLCGRSGDLRNPENLAAAVFRYNHSDSYVRTVLIWAAAYATGVTPTPAELAPEVDDVLEGERLPEGPVVLAMAPPAVAAPAPPPAPMPPTTPPATAPPAPATHPAESPAPISIAPPEIPAPSPPNVTPPEVTTSPDTTRPGEPPTSGPTAPPTSAPGASTPPESTTRPPESEPPSPTPPELTPPEATPPEPTPPELTPPELTPPELAPSEPPAACDPAVLSTGEFAATEQSPGATLEPGATDPHTAVPGQTVYVESETAGLLEPCVVPEAFTPPAQ